MFKLACRSLIAASVAAAFLFAPAAFAQVNVQELQKPGQLEEKVMGPADAKVTIIEYASMSCPHCAHFDATTFDQFKLKYVDSGKVRYIFREFPLNAPAFAVAMLARCAPAVAEAFAAELDAGVAERLGRRFIVENQSGWPDDRIEVSAA